MSTSILAPSARSLLCRASRRGAAGRRIGGGLVGASSSSRRFLSFSFVGPRKLSDIMKTELLEGKSTSEVSDIWMTYHEGKDRTHGMIMPGDESVDVLKKAKECPFFIQPIFRDDGFFMLVSQFQEPSHFLMAYLEDYKMDPARAQPLLAFSIFDDLARKLDLGLVRCDIINKGIEDDEGRKVVNNMLDAYRRDEEFLHVKAFNRVPDSFDVDDFISCQNQKWKKDEGEDAVP